MQRFLQHDALRRIREHQLGEPARVPDRPGRLPREPSAVTQQKGVDQLGLRRKFVTAASRARARSRIASCAGRGANAATCRAALPSRGGA
jgi:hypothetical protein